MSHQLGQLQSIFPAFDSSLLQDVLQQNNNDVQSAITALLQMSETNLTPTERTQVKEDELKSVIRKVVQMPNDPTAKQLVGNHGLDVMSVTWEDSARTKKSSWGPCISDMTLNVQNNDLPVIRYPNFEDLSWDVDMEKIPIVVGNEINSGTSQPHLYTITLKQYLEQFRMYLTHPEQWKGSQMSLFAASKDSHVLMSAQSSFLPISKDADTSFNVAIRNYQSSPGNPAVLAIVSTSQGTSAQIIEGDTFSGVQKLYFNKGGKSASFTATRLSTDRKQRNVTDLSAPLTKEEKEQNVITVIQVPLVHTNNSRSNAYVGGYSLLEEDSDGEGMKECMSLNQCSFGGAAPGSAAAPSSIMFKKRVARQSEEKSDVEHAIIKVGEASGDFKEVGGLEIKRDERYPVRVTLQYYKATSNGVIDDAIVTQISQQLNDARTNADFAGSLVVGGGDQSFRPTNTTGAQQKKEAVWWPNFWMQYKGQYSLLTEQEAKARVFKDGRFVDSSLLQVKDQVLAILNNGGVVHITPIPKHPYPMYCD